MKRLLYYLVLMAAVFLTMLAVAALKVLEGDVSDYALKIPVAGAGLAVITSRKRIRRWILKDGTDEQEKIKIVTQIYSLLQKELSDTKANEYMGISVEDLRQIKKFVNYYGKGKSTDQGFIDLFKKQYSEFYGIYIN